MQKTYVNDCISRKTIRNNGQLPKYLLPDHHEGIVDRQTFDAVQTEMARRNAGRSPSRKNAPTGRTSYASKYALSERLVCGECGTLYRRCVWAKRGKKRTGMPTVNWTVFFGLLVAVGILLCLLRNVIFGFRLVWRKVAKPLVWAVIVVEQNVGIYCHLEFFRCPVVITAEILLFNGGEKGFCNCIVVW